MTSPLAVFPETTFRRGFGLGIGGRYETVGVIPDGSRSLTLTIDQPVWTDGTARADLGVDYSMDNGKTWILLMSSDDTGGPTRIESKTGRLIDKIRFGYDGLPPGIGRLFRAWFNPQTKPIIAGPFNVSFS